MGKLTSYEVALSCGEPGQTSVGDVKGKEYYRCYAGKLQIFLPSHKPYLVLVGISVGLFFGWLVFFVASCHTPRGGFALNTRSVGS